MMGVEATVYEKRLLPGGLNATGVAPYKMHAEGALLEVGYLRTAIVVLAVIGIPGALPLSLVAGVVFLAWTVVEKRRQER